MANPDCDICQGSGRIWLHVRPRIMAKCEPYDVMAPTTISQREYACPECGGVVQAEKLVIVEAFTTVHSQITESLIAPHVHGNIASLLGAKLFENNLITFDKSPGAEYSLTYQVRGRIVVASQRVVATLEQRIAEREPDLAREIVAEAYQEIGQWPEINKAQARSIIRNSAEKILAQRREKRKESA